MDTALMRCSGVGAATQLDTLVSSSEEGNQRPARTARRLSGESWWHANTDRGVDGI